jgi:hypothetical protein
MEVDDGVDIFGEGNFSFLPFALEVALLPSLPSLLFYKCNVGGSGTYTVTWIAPAYFENATHLQNLQYGYEYSFELSDGVKQVTKNFTVLPPPGMKKDRQLGRSIN